MNGPKDELRSLWTCGSEAPPVDVEGVLNRMQQKSSEFERMIARRDVREMIAGLVVTVSFACLAYRSTDWLVRGSELYIAATGLWIIYWLKRHSSVRRDPPRDQSLADYHRALVESYDRQIRLLRTAKLWYVLPPWSGLMLFSFATWRRDHNTTGLLIQIATFTLTFGFVWWLNETWGVRYLSRKKAELAELVRSGTAE